VSRHELDSRLRAAAAWLDGAFTQAAERIERIHQAAGAHLIGVAAKSAQHKLKDARKKLAALDLDYLRLDWDALNRHSVRRSWTSTLANPTRPSWRSVPRSGSAPSATNW
jgi:hypothetical protein